MSCLRVFMFLALPVFSGCTFAAHQAYYGFEDPYVHVHLSGPIWHGLPFPIVGIAADTLAAFVPSDRPSYCGHWYSPEQTDELMHSARDMGATTIRFLATRRLTDDGKDFSRIDWAIARAKAWHLRVILVLENQGALCSGSGPKTSRWYRQTAFKGGDGGISYFDYVRQIVKRYRDEPTVLMWQLMNRAESVDAAGRPDSEALVNFALRMSYWVRYEDNNHLISLGMSALGRPGIDRATYDKIAAIVWIDVVDGALDNVERHSLSVEAIDVCVQAALRHRKACVVSDVGEGIASIREPKSLWLARVWREFTAARAASRGIDGMIVTFNGVGDQERSDPDAVDLPFKALGFVGHRLLIGLRLHP